MNRFPNGSQEYKLRAELGHCNWTAGFSTPGLTAREQKTQFAAHI
jgi:hypothetical protein